jgi:nucleoid-associated protein YgaU
MFARKIFDPHSNATGVPARSVVDQQRVTTVTTGEAESRISWDFGKISLHPPGGPNGRRAGPLPLEPPERSVMPRKLAIGPVDDPLEHEADAIADAVMRMPGPAPSVSAAPTQVNRQCADCEEENKKKLQRKSAGAVPASAVGVAPPIVHEVLRQPGQPLDGASEAFFETRFGRDLSAVRVHADDLASRSAEAVNADAYTVGSHIVFRNGSFAPQNSASLRLISHELAHVVQQTAPTTRGNSTDEGVAISGHAPPTIQRDMHLQEALPMLGTFTLEGKPIGSGLGAHEDVTITFNPDSLSPVADSIDFVQIAKPPSVEKPGDWAGEHPDEKLKSDTATVAGSATHLTQQGDTLTSVSRQHYGTAERAEEIFGQNRGRLVWWSAQSGGEQAKLLSRPLPVGIALTIPDAVRGGYMVDIKPQGVSPRSRREDPNISPDYPAKGVMTSMGSTIGWVNGFKRADGSKHPAQMTDSPGGGFTSGRFEFESAAFAKDIGLSYGAVRWGFHYSIDGITNEDAKLVSKVSDTFNAANVSFNRVYKNKHIVRQGETLNSISVLYFGTTAEVHRIYLMNKSNPALTTDDPAAPIAGGTQLEVGAGPTVWDRARGGADTK